MNYLDKPCAVCYESPVEDFGFIDEIFRAPHIKTPYHRMIIKNTNIGFWWENQQLNYIPYNFFVIKTRLRSQVPLIYDIDFASYQYKDKMIFVVVLRTAEGIVKLSRQEADQYQKLVDDFVKYEHCELIINYKYEKWYNEVLPFIELDEQYQPMIIDHQLLINLHPDRVYQDDTIKGSEVTNYYYDYLDVYLQLQQQLINKLDEMYAKGVIVADAIKDKDLIDEWQLVKYDFFNIDQIGLYTTTTNTYDYDITNKLMDLK